MTENTTTSAAPAATQPEAIGLALDVLREMLSDPDQRLDQCPARMARANQAARALAGVQAAPAAQEVEPAGYRISDPNEPDIGSWLSETPARTKYGLLSEPLYAHPPRPQADAGAVPEGWRLVPVEPTPEMVAAIPWPTNVTPTLGLDCYRAMLAAAPQAPAAATAVALEEAWRAGWAACRDAEYVGEEAEDWAWGASATNSLAIDIEQSAPAAAVAPAEAVERIVHLRADRARRIYVAGPMTGLPEYNFPAFNAAADRLRAEGWQVENPAEHGHVEGADWADYLRWDISRITTCGAIYLLPGWPSSKGANLEVHIAGVLGLQVILADGAEPVAAAPTQEAEDAARYRWLLRNYLSFSVCTEAIKHGSLDAAIDAARARQEGGGA